MNDETFEGILSDLKNEMAYTKDLQKELDALREENARLKKELENALFYVRRVWDETKGTEKEGTAIGAAHALQSIGEALNGRAKE